MKKTYYTLILGQPGPAIEVAVRDLDARFARLYARNELAAQGRSRGADVDPRETVTPRTLDDKFTRAFLKAHPECAALFKSGGLSYHRFRAYAPGSTPLLQNYLISLREIASFELIESPAGSFISFEDLMRETATPIAPAPKLSAMTVAQLEGEDLHAVFRKTQFYRPADQCTEDLLMSDQPQHWVRAAEKVNAGESPTELVGSLIELFKCSSDHSIRTSLLAGIHRVVTMASGGADGLPPFNDDAKADCDGPGREQLRGFVAGLRDHAADPAVLSTLRSFTT